MFYISSVQFKGKTFSSSLSPWIWQAGMGGIEMFSLMDGGFTKQVIFQAILVPNKLLLIL